MAGSSATAIFSALNVTANLSGSQHLCPKLNPSTNSSVITPGYNTKADSHNLGAHIETLYAFIGENLSEERFP